MDSNQDRDPRPLRGFSCLLCRQRKVKCDRQEPCSNCLKAQRPCSFVAPVRGKREKKLERTPKTTVHEGLHDKLRRYERMLEEHGEKLGQPLDHDTSDSDATPEPDIQTPVSSRSLGTRPQTKSVKAVQSTGYTTNPPPRNFDSTLWSSLGSELRQPDDAVPDEPIEPADLADENDNSLLAWLEGYPSHKQGSINLREFYPDQVIFSQFQNIFANRIDPMLKMLHLPSLFSTMTTALANSGNVPKSIEALLLCFCLATVSTMSQDQCQAVLNQDKTSAVRKYKRAATHALTNAGFVQSLDLTNLKALSLYLLGVKSFCSSATFHILCGLAVRLAMRAGLHRDGYILGLPPFETELRRRLWWHIIQLDFRTSDLLRIRPSLDLFVGDTEPPSNVEDEDISPGMMEPPKERTGITSMVLFRVHCDITQFLKRLYLCSLTSNASGFDIISSAPVSVEEKEKMISELEDAFESKYLRYCDPSEPLHMYVLIVIRSVICRMRVLTYNPRYYAEKQTQLTASEREIMFVNASKLLEYAALLRNTPSFHKYMGGTSATYIWDTILYVLIAARHRKAGPEIEQLWHLIGVLISPNPDTFGRAADAVHSALSKWIPEVWDEYAAAARSQGLSTPVPPDYLAEMRASRSATKPHPEYREAAVPPNSTDVMAQPMETPQKGILPPDDNFEFSNLDAFTADPNEWLQWERLLAGEDPFGGLLHSDVITVS
ncbi:putative C6 transcription factor [Xylogone sp. PMI_703]|nr:putative C6 transcription factor [Xylogone sp. PMI_703]